MKNPEAAERISEEPVWKGTAFWTDEIRNAGVFDQLRPFNDVIVEKHPPHWEQGPVLRDVVLDGKKCDVYHTDTKPGDTFHRIFIHIKES